jgi:hypothetical protein
MRLPYQELVLASQDWVSTQPTHPSSVIPSTHRGLLIVGRERPNAAVWPTHSAESESEPPLLDCDDLELDELLEELLNELELELDELLDELEELLEELEELLESESLLLDSSASLMLRISQSSWAQIFKAHPRAPRACAEAPPPERDCEPSARYTPMVSRTVSEGVSSSARCHSPFSSHSPDHARAVRVSVEGSRSS